VKLGYLLKAAPFALALVALLHGAVTDGLANEGGIGLTNVSGRPGDCVAPTRLAACATLFDGSTALFPGGPAIERSTTVTWHGNGHPASAFGLYVDNVGTRCAAADPAEKLDLTITQDGRLLYQGTLRQLTASHGAASDALPVHGDRGRFRIAVALDPSADNRYMGCVSTADLVWIASQ
jgi:hypothetical protein